MNVNILPENVPDDAYDTACRILKSSIKRFFDIPGVREDYEEWRANRER